MHDLLANLGKDIVHKESPYDPGQRSRLWFYEDVIQVLMGTTGTRNIKGIIVKLPKPAEITLNPKCFHNMVNLQIFINHNASLCGDINDLPNTLRLIDWDRCQLQSLPPNFQGKRLVEFNIPRSHIRQLDGFKHLPNLTSMDLRGCQFLEKIPDLSGIPNIEYLNLRECTRLVEVDGSIGLLDKLVVLNLSRCVKLTRFATRLRLKSLLALNLSDCKRLESFPEIEEKMESLYTLIISGSGIRELPASITSLTGLQVLELRGCFNLTRFATRLRLKSLLALDLSDCKRLESFPEIEVKMESLWSLDISGSGIRELPSSIAYLTGLSHFRADYCENLTYQKVNPQVSSSNSELPLLPNLSKSDFLLPLDCWSTLTDLNLSGNDFVILPRWFSKLVNLQHLDLRDCKSLLEIPEQVFPPEVGSVSLDNCTSLEKIPKMSWVLLDNCTSLEKILEFSPVHNNMDLDLNNCVRLRSYDITENIFLNQVSVSHPHSEFSINLSGGEVPKWFSCRKDATIVRQYLSSGIGTKRCEYDAGCAVSFEIPPNLKWETLRLVLFLYVVTGCSVSILLDGKLVNALSFGFMGHVHLRSIPLLNLDRYEYEFEEPLTKQGNTCQVIFDFFVEVPTPVKIPCGVHLLGHQVVIETVVVDHDQHQDCELLSLSLASKTSLGKRPRQSDYMALDDDHRANVVDIGDHEAQGLTLFTGPADHQKRRHIYPKVEPKGAMEKRLQLEGKEKQRQRVLAILNNACYTSISGAMKFQSGLCEPQVQMSKRTKFPAMV
ncbi:PREDICTED: TMV resistance protein N-like [Prunus mume]|uniref:TMV resistance protein N-like n=1 Tax=Prunus mume TaxID=102107 RepID=A0ABM0NYM0_PRUMU|nr:PREDICTED: TMV resistance protein N-like [Prunus mume]